MSRIRRIGLPTSSIFHVGDRVVTGEPLVGISVGISGTGVKVYAVLLDGLATLCFLFGGT